MEPAIGGPTPLTALLNVGVLLALNVPDLVTMRRLESGSAATTLDRHSFRILVILQTAGIAGAIVCARHLPGLAWPGSVYAWVAAGIATMIAGAVLRFWSIATLGRYFRPVVAVQPGQAVVSSGPYRWLRHPSYTGLLVEYTGFGVALDNAAALAVVIIVPAAGYLFRIRVEEAALLKMLGEEYRQFAARRKRIVPGVW